MTYSIKRAAASALALSLALGAAACSTPGVENNRSLYSVHEPVVQRSNYTLDLGAGASGLSIPEQARLAGWFEALELGYGDRVALDDPTSSPAVREDVAAIAGRYGLLLSETAPVTETYVEPGNVRVVVTRSFAHVPGCPDWSNQYTTSLGNFTSPGFGCAVNGNLAAMIADPEHLLEGARGTGETVVMTSNRAIDTYRNQEPTGAGGLPAISTEGQ